MNHSNEDDPSHTGRTILTALYLCMLGVCFVVPVFFYFRMHCDDRHNRRLRDLEIAGITQAMNESQDLHREESMAARRKYREERRARIIQLFTPVRMILKEENFVRPQVIKNSAEGEINIPYSNQSPSGSRERKDVEIDDAGTTTVTSASVQVQMLSEASGQAQSGNTDSNVEGYDDDGTFILVPKPGLPDGASIYEFTTNPVVAANKNQDINDLRMVPNECSICLCEYTVGSDAVWSSNPQCDHVFHANCIEQWLMKQRDGPLCPCCRRDFVIDPFDAGPGEIINDIEIGDSTGDSIIAAATTSSGSLEASVASAAEESMSPIDESDEDQPATAQNSSLSRSEVQMPNINQT